MLSEKPLPDPIEMGEAAAEAWADDNIRGSKFRCDGCGDWHPLSDAQPGGISPYAFPICSGCLDLELARVPSC